MPGKYEIDINVRDKSGGGAGSGSYAQAGGRGNMPSREQMAEVRDRRQQMQQAQRGTTASTNLEKAMMSLVKEQQKLTAEIRNLSAVMRTSTRGGGGGGMPRPGGGGGGGFGGGLGGGVSTIGAGLGFGIGAVLGIVGYAVKKVMDIGEAYIAKASQQVTSEGVGGFRGGGMGPWLAAETGQFYKAARMQGGQFNEGVKNTAAIGNFAHLFGLGGQEMGQMIGTFGRSTRRRTSSGEVIGGIGEGEEAFSRAVLTARKGGIETELLPMMQGITSALEDAVKDGVNASNLATDMAKELATAQKLAPATSVKALMATQQSIMGLQGQVAGGQFGSPAGYMMFRSGSEMWKRDEKFMLRARDAGLLTGDLIESARQGEKLNPNIERAVTQMYLEEKPLSARTEYAQQILRQFGGVTEGEINTGQISAAKRAQVMSLAQTYGFQGFETPAKAGKLIDLALGIGSTETGPGKYVSPGATSTDLMSAEVSSLAAGKTGRGAVGYEQTKEGALLGMGAPFAASAVNLQKTMLGSAQAMSDLATMALPALDAGISALGTGITATVQTITESVKKIQEEGFGSFIGDAFSEAFSGSFNPFSKKK